MIIEARSKKEASDRQNLRPQVKGETPTLPPEEG